MFKTLLFIAAIFMCLNVSAQSNGFGRGYYYDSNGQKITGFIKFDPTLSYLKYKTDSTGKSEKIKIENINAVVVGNDSLAVVQEGNSKSNRTTIHKQDLN